MVSLAAVFVFAALLPSGGAWAQTQLFVDVRTSGNDDIVFEGEIEQIFEIYLENNALAPAGGVRVDVRLSGLGSFVPDEDLERTANDGFTTVLGALFGNATIAAGQNSVRVARIIKDNVAENGEILRIRISNPTGALIRPLFASGPLERFSFVHVRDTHTIAFTDFTAATIDSSEGDVVELRASISGGLSSMVIALLNISGVMDGDYEVLPGASVNTENAPSVIFPRGGTVVRIRIEITDDNVPEGNEEMLVTFGAPFGSIPFGGRAVVSPVPADSQRRIRIARNDGSLQASLGTSSPTVAREGQQVRIPVVFTPSADLPADLITYVHFQINSISPTPTPVAGSDYRIAGDGIAFSNFSLRGRVRVNPGSGTAQYIPIDILGDAFSELVEAMQVTITRHNYNTNPNNSTVPSNSPDVSFSSLNSDAVVTIGANAPIFVAVNTDADTYLEDNSAVFKFTLIGPDRGTRNRDVNVQYQFAGTASAADYTDANGGSITIPVAAAATADNPFLLSIPLSADSATDSGLELNEILTLRITDVSGGGDGDALISRNAGSADATIDASTSIVHFGDISDACIVQSAPDAGCLSPLATRSIEGETWRVPITVSGRTDWDPTMIVFYRISGTATAGDYSITRTATHEPGVNIGATIPRDTIDIAITADDIEEVGETITLEILSTTRYGLGILGARLPEPNVLVHPAYNTITTTIADEDFTVSVSADKSTATEGEDVFFAFSYVDTLDRAATPQQAVTINYEITSGSTGPSRITTDDYTDSNGGSITIATADLSSSGVRITIASDMLAESAETLIFTIISVSGGVQNISSTADSARVNIPANDGVLVYAQADSLSVNEGGTVDFAICTLGEALTRDRELLVVTWTLTGTAVRVRRNPAATDDYAYDHILSFPLTAQEHAGHGCVRIHDGDPFRIAVNNDNRNEGEETIVITMTDVRDIRGQLPVQPSPDPVTITIAASDPLSVTATESNAATVAEGGSLNYVVDYGTTNVPSVALSVNYTVSGVDTTDYTDAGSGTITIPAGGANAAGRTVTIGIADDAITENAEDITVTFTGYSGGDGSGVINFTAADFTHTITANDGIRASVTAGDDVAEGEQAVFTFTVIGEVGTSTYTVTYATGGTFEGAASDDASLTTQLNCANDIVDGVCTVDVSINIPDDDVIEADETLTVTLSNLSGVNASVDTSVASLTVTDATPLAVSVVAPSVSVSEGSNAEFPLSFNLDPGLTIAADVTVAYDFSGDAVTDGSGSVTVAASESAGLITILVPDDNDNEASSNLSVTLDTVTGANIGDDSAIAIIAASDPVIVTLSGGGDVAEGGTATVDIALSGGNLTGDLELTYEVAGDAATDTAGGGMLTIATTDTAPYSFSIATTDDNINEAAKTFTVSATATTAGNADVVDSPQTFTITDNDPITVTVTGGGGVAEGSSITFTVTLSGGAHDSEVTVPWTLGATDATDDDDAEAADYSTAVQTPLTFAVGDSSDSVSVNITDDGVAEVEEKFAFTVGSVSTAGAHTVVGSPQVATIAASVNTVRTVAITGPTTVAEGDATTNYSVAVTGHRPTADISVTWSVTAGGTVAADFDGGLPAGAVLTFTPDNYLTAQTFTITTAEDTLLEGGEMFTVAIAVATASTGTTNGDGDTHDTAITDDDTATVTIARSDTDAFTEGGVGTVGTAVFTVTVADATLTAAADIAFTVTGADGTDDYIVAPTSPLSLTGTTGTITVTAVDDNINEASETVTVTITTVDTTGTIAIDTDNDDATADITDDDAIAVTVATTATTVDEGDSVTFTVTLSKASDAVVVVPYTVSGVSVGDVALTSLTGTVTVAAGQTESALTFDITRDASMESAETLTLALDASGYTPAGRGIARGTPASAMLTINASAATVRRLTISGPSTISETDAAVESGTYTVAIAEGDAFTAETAVTWTVSGVEDADFVAASDRSGSVTFAAGSKTSQTFTVTVAGDNLNEGDESFTVAIGVADATTDGGTAFGNAHTTVITDDDTITATLGGGGDVEEGDDASITVTLSGEMLTAAVVLEYSVTGAITASGVFTIATTDSAPHSFLLSTAENALNEADKMFTVNATATSAGTVTVAAAQTFTITDDDDITYRISGGGDVNESAGAVASFTVHLSGASAAEVTVPIEISGTAESSDYTAPATVAVAAGSVMQNFDITIVNDTVNEAAETVIVTVGAMPTVSTGGGSVTRTVTAAEQSATATIGASDPITYAIGADAEVAESAATVSIAVTLSGAAGGSEGGAVNVPFTVDTASTAADPADYTVTASPLAFTGGNGAMNITVTVKADTLSEQNETVILNLGTPTGGAGVGNFIAGADISATVTITDDDAITVTIARKSGESGAINEGDDATFTVTLSKTPTADVTVPFILSGEATATSPLTITAPATSGDITVTSTEDTRLESGETVMITLGTVSGGGGAISGSGEVTVAITDDDAATVTIARSDSDGFTEGGSGAAGTAVFTVTVADATLTTAADIAFTVTGAGGASDYVFSPLSPLRITGTDGTITVTAVDDSLNEASETVTVTLTAATTTGTINIGSTATATADITDNDPLSVTIRAGQSSVLEGGMVVFTVAIVGESTAAVVVPYTIGGDVAAGDYTDAGGGSLTIAAGQSGGSFSIQTVDDEMMEDAEDLTVTLGTSPSSAGTVNVGAENSATLLIAANASTVRDFSISVDSATVREGDTVTFTVSLAGRPLASGTSATVMVMVDAGDNADAADYMPTTITRILSLSSLGSSEFAVTIVDDDLNEGEEELIVTLANPAGGGGGGTGLDVASVTVTIAASNPITYAIGDDAAVSEGASQMQMFSVTLSGAADGSEAGMIMVPFTVGGSASAGTDYNLVTTSPLMFASGNAAMDIVLNVMSDEMFESHESVVINLAIPTTAGTDVGRFIPGSTSATLTILNDDALRVSIARTDSDGFTEGGSGAAGTAVFTVTVANGTSTAPVTVAFAIGGVGITAGDYTVTPTSPLTIAAGVATGTVTVTATDDSLGEAAEVLTVTVTDVTGGGGSDPPTVMTATASATIAANAGTATVTRVGSGAVDEGDEVQFQIRLSEPNAAAVMVAWSAAMETQTNTATAGLRRANNAQVPEFVNGDANGLSVSGMVNIPPMTMAMMFSLTPNQDASEEDAEEVMVRLGAVTVGTGGGAVTASATPATVTVRANEAVIRDEALLAEQMKSVSALLGRAAAVLTATVVRERLLRRPTRRAINLAGQPVAVVDAAVLASATGPWAADPYQRTVVAAASATGAAVTASDLVHETAFALPLFGREWVSGDASLWGAGGGISGSGKMGQLSYDEDATAFHIGADREWGDGFVAGLSIARTVGEVDAKQTVSNIEIKNRTESQMVSVHPYVLRRLGQHSHGWLVLGIGKSSVDVQETQFNVVRRASSDLTMTMAAFGAAWRRPVFVFDLTVHADGVLTRNQLQSATFDDGSLLPKVTSDTMQINLETEAGRTWECACGFIRIYATAALRDEFGDAKPDGGTAADVGGRLEWDGANGLLLRLRAAKQFAGDGDATRWSAEVDWNRAYRGLHRRFALVPYAQLTPDTWRTGFRLSGGRVTVRFGVDVDEDGIDYRHLLRGDVSF